MKMTNKESQDIDIREKDGFRYHRGSALSIFGSDRREDLVALLLSILIAAGVYLLV
jgi:hypothetical protein